MKITFARYEHSRIGFPGVVLKWEYDGVANVNPYLTVKGIIKPWHWRYRAEKVYQMKEEISKFEKYVSDMWNNDISVQG